MITVDDLHAVPLFKELPDGEAATVASRLADVRLREGEWLLHEGEQASFFMLLEGRLELFKVVHGIERKLDEYEVGTYFGEVPLLLGSPAIASLRAKLPSRVAQLDQNEFRAMFAECSTFRGELLAMMTRRIARLQTLAQTEPPPTATIVGHRYDIACHHLRDFLSRNRVVFKWADPTVPSDGAPPREGDRFPMVILPDGRKLVTPTLRELAEGLALQTEPNSTAYDVAIVGAGPAGHRTGSGLRLPRLRRRRAGRRLRPTHDRQLGAPPICPPSKSTISMCRSTPRPARKRSSAASI